MPVVFDKAPLPVINEEETHLAAALIVDNSDSMNGSPIQELNEVLVAFGEALREDSFAPGIADVTVISFNSRVETVEGFRPASQYEAPVLTAGGMTALNEAIISGLDAIEARKKEYRAACTNYYRPWLFLLTDGAPTDLEKENEAKRRLHEAIEQKKVVYMPMGIGAADTAKLKEYYPENYVDMKGKSLSKAVLKASIDNLMKLLMYPIYNARTMRPSTLDINLVQFPDLSGSITIEI